MEGRARTNPTATPSGRSRSRIRRWAFVLLLFIGFLSTQVSIVAAHDGSEHTLLAPWHGLVIIGIGVSIVLGAVLAKRTERLAPTYALNVILVGITVAAIGATLFDGLSGDPTYTADAMPFPRSWYAPIGLIAGFGTMVLSLIVGITKWPTRPRYTNLGILMGAWITYPELIPQPASYTHPFGYLIVLGTPILVGYIIWKDAWDVLIAVGRDQAVRRFSIGLGIVVTLFFMMSTGYLSVFPDEATPMETVFAVLPAVYQLVSWPTVEIFLPQIPLFVALSPGLLILNGLIGVLVGLNAALIARHWRIGNRTGTTEGTTGTAAILGSCTCGCCGPLVAKFAVIAAGPSIAAPLYWLFVDSASPLAVVFIVGSILLFTGTLVYAARSAEGAPRLVNAVPAD